MPPSVNGAVGPTPQSPHHPHPQPPSQPPLMGGLSFGMSTQPVACMGSSMGTGMGTGMGVPPGGYGRRPGESLGIAGSQPPTTGMGPLHVGGVSGHHHTQPMVIGDHSNPIIHNPAFARLMIDILCLSNVTSNGMLQILSSTPTYSYLATMVLTNLQTRAKRFKQHQHVKSSQILNTSINRSDPSSPQVGLNAAVTSPTAALATPTSATPQITQGGVSSQGVIGPTPEHAATMADGSNSTALITSPNSPTSFTSPSTAPTSTSAQPATSSLQSTTTPTSQQNLAPPSVPPTSPSSLVGQPAFVASDKKSLSRVVNALIQFVDEAVIQNSVLSDAGIPIEIALTGDHLGSGWGACGPPGSISPTGGKLRNGKRNKKDTGSGVLGAPVGQGTAGGKEGAVGKDANASTQSGASGNTGNSSVPSSPSVPPQPPFWQSLDTFTLGVPLPGVRLVWLTQPSVTQGSNGVSGTGTATNTSTGTNSSQTMAKIDKQRQGSGTRLGIYEPQLGHAFKSNSLIATVALITTSSLAWEAVWYNRRDRKWQSERYSILRFGAHRAKKMAVRRRVLSESVEPLEVVMSTAGNQGQSGGLNRGATMSGRGGLPVGDQPGGARGQPGTSESCGVVKRMKGRNTARGVVGVDGSEATITHSGESDYGGQRKGDDSEQIDEGMSGARGEKRNGYEKGEEVNAGVDTMREANLVDGWDAVTEFLESSVQRGWGGISASGTSKAGKGGKVGEGGESGIKKGSGDTGMSGLTSPKSQFIKTEKDRKKKLADGAVTANEVLIKEEDKSSSDVVMGDATVVTAKKDEATEREGKYEGQSRPITTTGFQPDSPSEPPAKQVEATSSSASSPCLSNRASSPPSSPSRTKPSHPLRPTGGVNAITAAGSPPIDNTWFEYRDVYLDGTSEVSPSFPPPSAVIAEQEISNRNGTHPSQGEGGDASALSVYSNRIPPTFLKRGIKPLPLPHQLDVVEDKTEETLHAIYVMGLDDCTPFMGVSGGGYHPHTQPTSGDSSVSQSPINHPDASPDEIEGPHHPYASPNERYADSIDGLGEGGSDYSQWSSFPYQQYSPSSSHPDAPPHHPHSSHREDLSGCGVQVLFHAREGIWEVRPTQPNALPRDASSMETCEEGGHVSGGADGGGGYEAGGYGDQTGGGDLLHDRCVFPSKLFGEWRARAMAIAATSSLIKRLRRTHMGEDEGPEYGGEAGAEGEQR
eukprot:GHVN01020349.1.p1 GENE.GHVN01020349.1~~GHVN01020349.1.p1  ORF type:complete len:1338 (-),score=378.00 GHVN01020349.1:216-3845(-)